MNLKELVGDNILIVQERPSSVENAINTMGSLLLERRNIEPNYLQAIKNTHNEIGAYYVLAPKIAMPHARPEDGVNKAGLQVTIFKNGADLESTDNGDVYLAIMLAAKDAENHLQTITKLATLFQNEQDIERLIVAQNAVEVADILANY